MNYSKVAILILAGGGRRYEPLVKAVRESWIVEAQKLGVTVYFYRGGSQKDMIVDDYLHVNVDDSLEHCYLKFIAAAKFLCKINPDVQVIFRTNISSYIDMENFASYLAVNHLHENTLFGYQGTAHIWAERLHRWKYISYALRIAKIGPSFNYYSGAGFFIGKNVLYQLSDSPGNYMIDDVEIGYQNPLHSSSDTPFTRIYITDNFVKMSKMDYDSLLKQGLFHYKFKTSDRLMDAKCIMKFGDENSRVEFLTN
jgi:hypothetical protein